MGSRAVRPPTRPRASARVRPGSAAPRAGGPEVGAVRSGSEVRCPSVRSRAPAPRVRAARARFTLLSGRGLTLRRRAQALTADHVRAAALAMGLGQEFTKVDVENRLRDTHGLTGFNTDTVSKYLARMCTQEQLLVRTGTAPPRWQVKGACLPP
jgi:hypothetical protein